MLKVTPISVDQVIKHARSDDPEDKLIPGLYSWSEQDWDDTMPPGTFTHCVSWADNDQFLWAIDDSSESGFGTRLTIRVVDYREAYDVPTEVFLEFVTKRTPEALEWLYFNADLWT